jgi:hypothetical protein
MYNQPLEIGAIPASVKYLKFTNAYNHSLDNGILSSSVTCLKIGPIKAEFYFNRLNDIIDPLCS